MNGAETISCHPAAVAVLALLHDCSGLFPGKMYPHCSLCFHGVLWKTEPAAMVP